MREPSAEARAERIEEAARALLGCNTRAPIADGESAEWVAVSGEHLAALRVALMEAPAAGDALRAREECCVCQGHTGKAGAGDGSLYASGGGGPFCERCWNLIHDDDGNVRAPSSEAGTRGPAGDDPLTFAQFREANVRRCRYNFHPLEGWTETDWACALAGEVGELCNLLKKRLRWKMGFPNPGEKAPPSDQECADEAGDVVAYLDLCCARMGIDLGAAVRSKFNRVSVRVGSDVTLDASAPGKATLQACGEMVRDEANELAAERDALKAVLLSRHGGEPLALLAELDEARALLKEARDIFDSNGITPNGHPLLPRIDAALARKETT